MPAVFEERIDVAAPAATVWLVLADLAGWPTWNRSVRSVDRAGDGSPTVGERVVVSQRRLPTTTWTVTEVEERRSFTWVATAPGVRSVGEHELVDRGPDGCTAVLRLTQHGPGGRLVALLYGRLTRRFVRWEAEGLKARAEGRPARPPADRSRP